jgi:starvation-inducible DNA-binding protein
LLEEIVDELAERIRSIGGRSIGTLIEFTDETRLSEVPKEYPHADKMLKNLLLD